MRRRAHQALVVLHLLLVLREVQRRECGVQVLVRPRAEGLRVRVWIRVRNRAKFPIRVMVNVDLG